MAHSPLLYPTRNTGSVSIIRRMSMETYMVRIYTGPLSQEHEFVSVEAEKVTTAEDVVRNAVGKLRLSDPQNYELAEVFSSAGQLCKERRLDKSENPVRVQLLWPKVVNADMDHGLGLHTGYRFYIRKINLENSLRTSSWMEYSDPNPVDNFLTAFLKQPANKEYSDLCNLPDLNERTLLENIKLRFVNSNIYTYVGSILIAVNPFKFFPIYNPKYVKMYQNKRLGDLPPHIFAIADAAFHTMLRSKKNQCIVISGESGSGKTESTNLLLHHLTALSHKGLHGSGVEQTILGAGPVLEAFGNAKTVHNNNSSRFGKFIQVNYKENGMLHGAIVEKYLLEKSRIVSQAKNERNYHVFYYLLAGADDLEREKLHLGKPEEYVYLNQSGCIGLEEVDEANEFSRLKQSMEMVGFSQVTQKRIFGVLSAVLHLGNVKFKKKGDQHHDESVTILNPDTIAVISQVLKVHEKTLMEALTQKKATAGDETVVMTHRMEDALATRDAMAKCLYGALFDWIVLKVNQALLAKRHNSEHQGNSIGVLDIFGFEDFSKNSFEQFCINYANEHLQYYFNQHIFKFEQEEYKKEGIQWKNIEFIDNTGCLELFSRRPNGLFCLLDEECSFPAATNETLLTKFHQNNKGNVYYEAPQKREMAFTVVHYAGKVKYQTQDFREKNSDQIRTDIVGNLKSSSLSFVRELMGVDPVAVLRWTILKTLFKSVFAFIKAGKTYRERGGPSQAIVHRRKQSQDIIPELGTANFLRPPQTDHHGNRSPKSPLHVFRYSKHAPTDSGNMDGDDVFVHSPAHSPRHSGHSPRHSDHIMSPAVDPYLSEDEADLMRKATLVLLKNKSFKPRSRPQTMFSDIKTLKAIASRTMYSGGKVNTKLMKTPSVSAQFQWSLSRLMSTLNQANPFFIRCIKSNAEKLACTFNELLVLRQLRYTGMLATVRIRQSGYNYRLTFEEFTQLYKILLPNGLQSDKSDVKSFLESKNMNTDNYQIGKTKVFLREGEKLNLDECLHRAIMARVICIQRWVKTKVERKNYLLLKENTVLLQRHIRVFLAQRKLHHMREAVFLIQRWYRGSRVRAQYTLVKNSAIRIQAHFKGHLTRKRYRQLRDEAHAKRLLEQDALRQSEDMHSSASDEGVLIKDTSADDLDIPYCRRDSEESSGILDDSESDTLSEAKSRGDSIGSPPPTPTSVGPDIVIEGLPAKKDEILLQAKQSSRVQNLTKVFQSQEGRRGDDESPTTDKPSQLSPERVKHIEDNLRKPRQPDSLPITSADDLHKSPIKNAFKKLVGTNKKKNSYADDSDNEEESSSVGRKHAGGVQVLPTGVLPTSPKSPQKEETSSVFSDNDQQEEKKPIKKQRRTLRQNKEVKDNRPVDQQKGWSVSKTSQWQYPDDWIISEIYEFQLLDDFINLKIQSFTREKGEKAKETQFDTVFKKCLKSFHTELKTTLSIVMQKQSEKCNIKYRDLFAQFQGIMEMTCRSEKLDSDFPVTMCINAFRGFLDEFRNSVNTKKKDNKYKKKIRPKREKVKKDTIDYKGHKFNQVQFGIPTFCEWCSNLIWIMEKSYVCQVCKYTCHKKCIYKSLTVCKGAQDASGPRIAGTKVFGVPIPSLVEEGEKIPVFLENLIMLVENHGLFTEGIYRKSGSAQKMKMLKMALDNGTTDVNIEEFTIHVITSTLKSFFRELPEPLLTFELYDEFVQASEIQVEKEAIQVLYALVERLPRVNHDVFERLVFHLARVANHEKSNKMSVNGLAIIFAPCLLRTNKNVQAQDMLSQVTLQTIVIEKILDEQLRKFQTTMQDIKTLESAENTANERLTVVRASMRNTKSPKSTRRTEAPPSLSEDQENLEEQERVINSHLKSLRKEKDDLTQTLPTLEYRHSSDDEMLSADDIESTYDTADEDMPPTFDLPELLC